MEHTNKIKYLDRSAFGPLVPPLAGYGAASSGIEGKRMTETQDIAHAAQRLHGTPDEIAATLADLIEAYPHELKGDVSFRERRLYREALAAHWLSVFAHRHWLTHEFARRRGWKFRREDHFTQAMLRERRKRRRQSDLGGVGWSDHDYFFRDAAGAPVAVAGHPYGADRPEFRAYYEGIAASFGVQASFPTDFPSWWYPGRTTLVLFERGAA